MLFGTLFALLGLATIASRSAEGRWLDSTNSIYASDGTSGNSTGDNLLLNCGFRGEGFAVAEDFIVQHVVNQQLNTLTVEITYQGEGWLAFGASVDGMMKGSEVVIALPDEAMSATNPGKYSLVSKVPQSAVELMPAQTLINASFQQSDGVTILRYTKALIEENEIEISKEGTNRFVWGYGSSNTLGYHAKRGDFTIQQLRQCLEQGAGVDPNDDENQNVVAGSSEPPKQSLWVAHGVLMFISWGVLIPVGVGSSLIRQLVPGKDIWFKLHQFCNGLAFMLMTAGFGIAVNNVRSSGNTVFSNRRHGTIGLVVYIFSFLQVLSGIRRPHLPQAIAPTTDAEDDKEANNEDVISVEIPQKSKQRMGFEIIHRIIGFGLLGLSWYNLYLGMFLIVAFYGSSYDLSPAMWGVIGGISGLFFFLFVYCKMVSIRKGD